MQAHERDVFKLVMIVLALEFSLPVREPSREARVSEGGPKWPVSAFGRAKKWRSRVREAEREEGKASNTMAHERHISVCRTGGGRTADGRGGRTTETETGVEDDWRLQGRHDVRKMGRLKQRLIKARQNPPTLPTSHLILETGTMIFVFNLMFSSVGYENRQFGLSEFR